MALPFLFDIPLYICYFYKTEQPADTIDNQNCKRYTSLGIFFSQPEISEKTPLNPRSNWVYNLNIKDTKKQKKIPFGIFSVRLVSFLTQNHIRIFQQKTSLVIPKISASDNGKKPNTSRDILLYRTYALPLKVPLIRGI